MEWHRQEFTISTNKSRLDIEYIHRFLSGSYWAAGIPLAIVKKSVEGSVCFGVYHQERTIGFARVVTDKATFGYLADVFIDETYRGKGLSKWLMESIMSHPELQGLRRFMLATRDAHGLYRKFGFTVIATPENLMQVHKPEIYG